MTENLEQIAKTASELESLIGAMEIPMPADFHLLQLKTLLPEKVKAIKQAIINETGENPWE